MRLPTRNVLSSLSLAGAVGLVFVASLSGLSELFGGAVLCLLVAAAVSLMRVDRRVPTEDQTRAFVAGVLQARGYAGAFSIGGFSQLTSAGIEPGHVRVKFRGELAFHDALYQPSAPPADAFKGFTARKIEWLRKTAEMLERELGSQAAGLAARAPADPYRVTFVAVRKPGGWTLPFTGSAWAVRRGESWTWDLRNLSQSVDSLVVHGKPLAAFPAAVALASPEGKGWLNTCLAAWREYEAEVTALQQKIDEVRAARARDAMGGFFSDVQAGTTYHGTGESLTQQVGVARYFLEFTSAHAANHTVAFTLRSDRRWQLARPFAGTVAFDAASGRVTIQARTAAADAQRDAGPLLSVATAFDLELQWLPGSPARLEGTAVDLVLRLTQASPDELGRLVEEAHAREREIAAAIVPGGVYRGSVSVEGAERPLKVEFLPSVDLAAAAARVESGDWSAMFRVLTGGEALEPGFDLALESTAPVVVARPAADAGKAVVTCETWSVLLLRLASGRFSGMVVSGEARLPISQLAPTPSPPA
jgi:hypothetical protein